ITLIICYVHQTPADLLGEINNKVKLTCKHTIKSYDTILWYQRSPGNPSLKLVGFTSYTSIQTVENSFQGSFKVSGDGEKEAFLHMLKLRHPENTGDYFCASEAYFGTGTKLTVLESNRTISPPTVTVLPPSKKEKNKKTLVCVASRFYPDHVSVSWQIDGDNITDGVATDSAARLEGEHYSITSRLRVPLKTWLTQGKKFNCTVSFFNGNETVYRSDWVAGVKGCLAEKYLKITNAAKLTYAVLIAKSSFYGAFVVFLVCSRKDF
uniref:Ig-like domain-containing protein n=1 Tax=Dicentrarchus labrax TaxID=13489 RepID=A0A8C4IBS8_DICLA